MTTSIEAVNDRLFSALSPAVRALAMRGSLRSYRKHTVIACEGEPADSTFVLLQGKVKVYSNNLEGREITFDVVEAGDYLTEIGSENEPRAASLMTLEPCVCSVVGRSALLEHITRRPEFALDLVAHVIRRTRDVTRMARELALLDVYGRVVSELEGRHGAGSAQVPVVIAPMTHQALASRVGASREMVSRLLKDLERGGYVELGVKRITLRRKLPARY